MPEIVADCCRSGRFLLVAAAVLFGLDTGSLSAQMLPPVTAAAFSPDGLQVLIGSQAGLQRLSWPGLEVLEELPTRLSHIHDLQFSPAGDEFVAVGGSPAESGVIEWYGFPSGELITSKSLSEDLLYSVAFAGGGPGWLAAGGADRNIYVLNEQRETIAIWTNHSHPILAICSLKEGASLVSGGVDQGLRVWNSETGDVLRTLSNHTAPILGLAVRSAAEKPPHPYVVSIGEDRTVRLWQPTLGRLVRFVRLSVIPQSVDWTCDGSRIVVGCRDGAVRVIDPDSIEVVQELPALEGWVQTLVCHPQRDEALAAGTNGKVVRIVLSGNR